MITVISFGLEFNLLFRSSMDLDAQTAFLDAQTAGLDAHTAVLDAQTAVLDAQNKWKNILVKISGI